MLWRTARKCSVRAFKLFQSENALERTAHRSSGIDRAPKVWGLSVWKIGDCQSPEGTGLAALWEQKRSDLVQRPCGLLRHEGVPGFAGVQAVSVQGVKILSAVEGRRD